MMPAAEADLAVVGGGPAGAAAALFAARRGFRVIVVDKQDFPRDKPCGEGLMPSGRPALRELGLEDAVVAGGAPALNGIQFGLAGEAPVAVPFPTMRGSRRGWGSGGSPSMRNWPTRSATIRTSSSASRPKRAR